MAGRDGEAQRFFVSYADADRGWAEWIAWELENAKHEVLIQAWDFGPGLHFVGMMNRAFDGGRRTVAVLSAAYLESAFTTEEWQAAWAANPDGQERLLLVARVEDCDPPPLLRQVVYVDLFGVDKEVARERLLDAITLRRRKPAEEPAFPRTLGRGTAEPSRPSQVRAMAVPAARSAYLEQVRQIAPRRLVGREAELARLAAFCAAPDDPTATGYMWWRAAAWTGKSALMSTFVLDPPAGVRVVSFFITSRYAGNSNRAAFVEIVTEQLAELLDESVPPFQDEGRRERLWFKWFADAAAFCKARGERLVLVVDGLDEDRGVTGHGARSIAGLLPANPREGARVVVAGRPDPPVPSDVPPGHPLRNPSIIEILGRSEHAAAIRADMREALYRLRTGGPLERDLLGLVTAAGGGLSGRDLEELSTDSDVTEWDIDQLLETVAGRGFSRRAARWNPAAGPRVYLLGHEEIQQDAERAYGRTKLAAYRDRLHTWAEEYRQRGWAADTPEYLLRGYYRLLLATGDLPRAVDCATDQARHDRMLDLSGGDTAALAEITEAQNALLAQPSPDVTLMARLAVHKQQITERNRNIPIRLPAVWVTLGHATRAEQLAHAIADPDSRVRALVTVARVLVEVGEHSRAEQVAHAIADPDSRVRALVTVARALVEVGEHSRAAQVVSDTEQLAHAMTDPNSRVWALVTVARVLVEVGERGRAAQVVSDAEQVARAVTRSDSRAEALVSVAGALAEMGEYGRAAQVVSDAEQVARAVTDPHFPVGALVSVAGALAEMGEYGRAAQVVSDAEQVARAVTHPFFRVWALVSVARALAKAGEHGRAAQVVSDAEQVARAITDPFYQARALVLVAGTLAPAGEPARAEQVARAITSPDCLVQALVPVAEALAEVGEHGRAAQIASDAEQAARAITDPDSQVRALVTLAEALAEVGEHGRAAQVVSDAEQVARAMTDPASRGRELAPVARVLAQAGELARAEEVARAITDPFLRIRALAPWAEEWAEVAEHIARSDPDSMVRELMTVAKALAQAGKLARAAQVASDAEQVARAITDPFLQARALVTVVDALAEAGEFARAEQLAHAMTGPFFQARALVTVVDALAEAGEFARAEQLADAMTGPFFQAEALVTVVYALAEAGEFARAEQLAHAITDPDFQVRALVRVAGALAEVGERGRAAQVVSDAEQVARAITDPFFRVRALVTVVYALAKVGERGRAAQAANDAEQVARAMTKPEVQAWALVAVAGALASVEGRVRAAQAANDAEQVARGMTNPDVRARVLVTVAGALAEVGEFARAEQVVRAITRSESQVEALVTVAGALAEAGEHARAEQLARALADPYSQAEALVAVAGALAQANSRTSANRLLAVALSVGDWRRLPLPVVAGVSPDAIRAMAAAIVSDQTA